MHGHPIVAVESFVDSQLMFRGTAYKAAGWMLLGPSGGLRTAAPRIFISGMIGLSNCGCARWTPRATAALKAQPTRNWRLTNKRRRPARSRANRC